MVEVNEWPDRPRETTDVPRLDTLHFNSTKTCNLGCVFCYDKAVRGRTENLPLKVVREIAQDAVDLGARRVILSGGEPMARKDWRDVAEVFDSLGFEVSLATNGTLINGDVANFLLKLRKLSISISLDGGPEFHDRVRRQIGAYESTIGGLKALKARGIKFDLNATLYKENVNEIKHLTKISRDYDCDMRLSLLHPNGRGKEMADLCLSPEEIFRIREYCHVMRKNFGVKVFLNLPPLLQYLDEIIPGRGTACGWAENFCGVLANGDVSICGVASDEPELVAGNVHEKRFKDIWATAALFKYTRSLKTKDLKGICGPCPFNSICGGACRLSAYKEENDFQAPYELCQRFYDQGFIPDELLKPGIDPAAVQSQKPSRDKSQNVLEMQWRNAASNNVALPS